MSYADYKKHSDHFEESIVELKKVYEENYNDGAFHEEISLLIENAVGLEMELNEEAQAEAVKMEYRIKGMEATLNNEGRGYCVGLAANVDNLAEALREYGKHKAGCKTKLIDHSIAKDYHYKECTCGFEQALKEIK